MPDRLQELLQQRALIKEHLAWLESEIATASGRPLPVPPTTTTAPTSRVTSIPVAIATVAAPATVPTPAPKVGDVEAERLLAKYAAQERQSVAPPDKKGCWIVFSTALLILSGIAVGLVYYFYR